VKLELEGFEVLMGQVLTTLPWVAEHDKVVDPRRRHAAWRGLALLFPMPTVCLQVLGASRWHPAFYRHCAVSSSYGPLCAST